jgi:chromosomal replication initiation ATPase DnaA
MSLEKLEQVDSEIKNFKLKIFKEYNIDLVIFSYERKEFKKIKIPLLNLWTIYINHIKECYPEYFQYTDFRNNSRNRIWITLHQSFCYIAYNDLNYTYSEIGRFVNKDHTTIIHQIKKVDDYIDKKDLLFCNIHELMLIKYKEYVGTIYKNSKI